MDKLETLKTILVLSLAMVIGYLIFKVKWLLWIAVALLAGSTFENRVISLIARGWMRFATFIGNINSKILLSVIFYLIMTPLAIAYRLTHKRSVDHFTHDTKKSYFDDIQPVCGKETFEKVW